MIKVNEIFGPTIQGEGRSLGKEVHFLRLANCNLHCEWCDSKHTWDWKNYDKKKEVHPMTVGEIEKELYLLNSHIRALVVTGGEPLIQQRELIPLFTQLKNWGWWIEIETNGTLKPLEKIIGLVDQFNVSPKLANCGDPKKRRIKPEVLSYLGRLKKADFKFVVGSEDDLIEIDELFETCNVPRERTFIMPLGQTREELQLSKKRAIRIAAEHNLLYSPRKHIEMFGSKRGV